MSDVEIIDETENTTEVSDNIKNKTSMQDDDIDSARSNMTRVERLRSDSGNVEFSDTLTTFFYLLLRDHLSAGAVESLVMAATSRVNHVLFANGFLAQYADNLANELKSAKVNTLTNTLEELFSDGSGKSKSKKSAEMARLDDEELLAKLQAAVDRSVEEDKKNLANLEEIDLDDDEDDDMDEDDFEDNDEDDDSEDEPVTRESILEKRSKEHKEHMATNEDAEKLAKDYVKDQVEKALIAEKPNDKTSGQVSRGKLGEVRAGRAFPEVLDNLFEGSEKSTKVSKAASDVLATLREMSDEELDDLKTAWDFMNEKNIVFNGSKEDIKFLKNTKMAKPDDTKLNVESQDSVVEKFNGNFKRASGEEIQ